jgi:phosphoribosylformylglycinamidine synthase
MGAGGGWAKSVLFNAKLRDQFEQFFHRDDTFT